MVGNGRFGTEPLVWAETEGGMSEVSEAKRNVRAGLSTERNGANELWGAKAAGNGGREEEREARRTAGIPSGRSAPEFVREVQRSRQPSPDIPRSGANGDQPDRSESPNLR